MKGLAFKRFGFYWSTNDPNTAYDGNDNNSSGTGGITSFNLPMWGIWGGSRFYLSDNIGLWIDAGWHGLVGAIFNGGLVVKF